MIALGPARTYDEQLERSSYAVAHTLEVLDWFGQKEPTAQGYPDVSGQTFSTRTAAFNAANAAIDQVGRQGSRAVRRAVRMARRFVRGQIAAQARAKYRQAN